ncbi:MAG: universal stress protein [Anaerolineaceae bacterium]|nr:universal stress protein [Anaerolineaceae bacterium]
MFKRILVPLDGSTLAERAIPHAEQFARIFGSSIILLQILDPTSYHENPNAVDPLSWKIRKAEADMYMKGIAARMSGNLGVNTTDAKSPHGSRGSQDGQSTFQDEKKDRVSYSIREGKTAENIVNFAHTEAIDLLVISTHGSGGLSRWNLSSVTHKVINLIYLPVLIVRAYNQPEPEESRIHYRRILLPIDSSRRAECALPAGIALARGERSAQMASGENAPQPQASPSASASLQSKLILAAVIKPPEIPIPEPYPVEIERLSEQLMQVSRETVSNYVNEMKKRLSVDCEACVVENKSVSSAIQELAKQGEDIDLVVLCAHGYTGQSNWPYGSVARNYMEHGTKTALIIQDVARSQVLPTAAEIAAEKSGGR